MNEGHSLAMWTVYYSPREYPGKYVARKFLVATTMSITNDMFIADSLDEIRALLPPGLYCLSRNTDDDPVIVETWV